MTVRRIHKHEAAKRSLAEIADYLAREADLATALRFLDRAEETFALLLESPGVGHRPDFRSLALGDVRVWFVHDFPNLLIYYRDEAEGIVILDVMHGAREQEQRLREKFERPT